MSRLITIRLGEDEYQRIKAAADADNRSLSNFMETATLRLLDQTEFVDEHEMAGIRRDRDLMKSLKAGSADIRKGRYRIVRDRRDC